MKRVIIMGSPRSNGRSAHVAETLFEAHIDERPEDELFLVPVSEIEVGPCIGCNACREPTEVVLLGDGADSGAGSDTGGGNDSKRTERRPRCVFDDDMQTLYDLLDDADELTIVSPVYFSGAPSMLKCLLDRLQPYYWAGTRKAPKRPAALHVLGEGGDPHGFDPLVSEVKSSVACAGFRLERVLNWIGKVDENGEIVAEADEVEIAPASGAITGAPASRSTGARSKSGADASGNGSVNAGGTGATHKRQARSEKPERGAKRAKSPKAPRGAQPSQGSQPPKSSKAPRGSKPLKSSEPHEAPKRRAAQRAARSSTCQQARKRAGTVASDRLSPYSTPSATRKVLERHGLYTKYGLGQNFLVNDDVIRKILELAEVQASDHILEVGPGIGTLTAALLQCAGHVTSIEKDYDLPAVLSDTLAPWEDRFTLLNMDALDVDASDLGGNADEGGACAKAPDMSGASPEASGPRFSRSIGVGPSRVGGGSGVGVGSVSGDGFGMEPGGGSGGAGGPSGPGGGPDMGSGGPSGPGGGSGMEPDDVGSGRPRVGVGNGSGGAGGADEVGGEGSDRDFDGCFGDGFGELPNKLVSNLPYAVAATVVLDYLQRLDCLDSATVMVQKEVADRMMAKPGTKAYGAYTVKLSLVAQPVGRFAVAPGNFFPPPHVESAVLRLNRHVACDDEGRELGCDELAAACTMADAAFATRRKTLANSCKTFFAGKPDAPVDLARLFEIADVDPRRRGETLGQREFIALGRALLSLSRAR